MSDYKQVRDQNAVIHTPTSRVIYLDQPPTIHSDAYMGWVAKGGVADQADPAPEPADPAPNPRIYQIKQELAALDVKKIRPLAEGDEEYLAALNGKTLTLRNELKDLLE